MKRFLLVMLCVATLAAMSMAQVTYNGLVGGNPIGQSTPIDKLGAHNNGGRGCTGCPAPHSGAWGNGGNLITGTVEDTDTGIQDLWGQDMGPMAGATFSWGDDGKFPQTFPALGSLYTLANEPVTKGIMFCLSCHDGQVAKGAMMTNQSWEQKYGLLPDTYGTGTIPTLLADDSGPNNYENDHPVGVTATLGAVGIASRLTVTAGKYTTTDSALLEFYGNYGLPQFYGRSKPVQPNGSPDGTPTDNYIVCTTCHTPHSMYTTTASSSNKFGGISSGTFATFFFINAPYNPSHVPDGPGQASSVAQFCRQCHFTGAGGSNEGSNIHGVKTAF